MKKPLILVTNDDGIDSPGIRLLVGLMKEFGEVVVLAPDAPQSGMAHAVTVTESLRLSSNNLFDGIISYQCSGTPVDCVKLARHHLLKDRAPDLVVSGINHGSNASISVVYSGTMSAALEAAINGIPAIGFSVCDHSQEADLSHAIPVIREIASRVLQHRLPYGVALNVNIPAANGKPLKGIRICRQTKARWKENFDQQSAVEGELCFLLSGDLINLDEGTDHDVWAIDNNYVAVVPVQADLTAYDLIEKLKIQFNGSGR
jgi:5'-nucleotidase